MASRDYEVLKNVDRTKREKFNDKYEKLAEREWTRDTFRKNMKETQQAIENIEDFITGLQDELEDYRRESNGNRFDEITEDFGGEDELERLQEQEIHPRDFPTLGRLREAEQERGDILQRIIEWKTLQFELSEMASKKMTRVADTLDEKFRSGQARRDFENYVQDKLDDRMEKVKSEIKQHFQEDVAHLEQAIQAARSEVKFAHSYMEKFGKASVEELKYIGDSAESIEDLDVEESRIIRVPDDAPDLADFMNDDGTAELAGRKLKDSQDKEAVEESQEEKLPDTDDGEEDQQEDLYEIKQKPLEKQKEVVDRMSEELDFSNLSKKAIAEKTDITRGGLWNSGKVMDKIQEQYDVDYDI